MHWSFAFALAMEKDQQRSSYFPQKLAAFDKYKL